MKHQKAVKGLEKSIGALRTLLKHQKTLQTPVKYKKMVWTLVKAVQYSEDPCEASEHPLGL